MQVSLNEAAAASPESPVVVQARSKYFVAATATCDGEAAAVPFSARGGAHGSLFKNANRGKVEANATDQPLVKKSSPRDGVLCARLCHENGIAVCFQGLMLSPSCCSYRKIEAVSIS
jgi:hypothetical protein